MKKEERNERIFLEFRKDFLIGLGIFKISRSFRSILDIGCTVHNFRKLGNVQVRWVFKSTVYSDQTFKSYSHIN